MLASTASFWVTAGAPSLDTKPSESLDSVDRIGDSRHLVKSAMSLSRQDASALGTSKALGVATLKELCIVVPIFNDGDLAGKLCSELEEIFTQFFGTQDLSSKLDVLFVDDGSANG